MQLAFKRAGVCVERKEIVHKAKDATYPPLTPTLVKKSWEGKNIVLYFKLPVGLSLEKVYDNLGVLCDSIGSEIILKRIEGDFKSDFKMTILHGHLKDKIPYTNDAMLIPKKEGSIYVPVGYGRRGFEYVDITDPETAHILVAGTSGSGKSTLLRLIIASLHLNYTDNEIQLWLADFKNGAEFSLFRNTTLVKKSIKSVFDAEQFFLDALKECERRYNLMGNADTPDIDKYNEKFPDKKLPHIIIMIDELIMLDGMKPLLMALKQLGSIGRAGGVHLCLSTQRPSADILDGSLKSNLGCIIGFRTRNAVSSRIIMGEKDSRLAYIDPDTPGRCILSTVRDVYAQVPYLLPDQCVALMKPYYRTPVKVRNSSGTVQYKKTV
jgi:S-DNA-T family DNA segregation ATPase FtsK/SpoIIIE